MEPNGTSLCMEELGDGFFVFFVGFGVFGCYLTHVFRFSNDLAGVLW